MYTVYEDHNGWYVLADTDDVHHEGVALESFETAQEAWDYSESFAEKTADEVGANAIYTVHPDIPRAAVWTLRPK